MKKADVIDDVKTSLGYPVIDVYLEDSMIEKQIDKTLRKFSSNVFNKQIVTHPAQDTIDLERTKIAYVEEVLPIVPKEGDYLYSRDAFSLHESQKYFAGMPGDLVGPLTARILKNQINRVLDSDFDWSYESETGKIYLDNIPPQVSLVAITLKTYHDLNTIPGYGYDWFYEYVLALCKIIEGKIRRKFSDSMPGAPSDGADLVSEGEADKSRLDNELDDLIPYDIGVRD